MKRYRVEPISISAMKEFIFKWHYSQTVPRLTKICLGGYREGRLVAVMSLGWGARPLHTIQALFPTLTTKDYFEIGRMALEDDEPRNSESQFISQIISWLKEHQPQLKLLFSWSDGMLGKPGYVYQASNFLYGGFIETDTYSNADGEKLHPLQLQAYRSREGEVITARTKRPSITEQEDAGWSHYFGYQFRYAYFLGSKRNNNTLISTSTTDWNRVYPKDADCKWRIQAGVGSRVNCEAPSFVRSVQFRHPAPLGQGSLDFA